MRMRLPPGTYTVRLTAGDATQEQPLEVFRDPASDGTDADMERQMAVVRELYDTVDAAAKLINGIEELRVQLDDLGERLADGGLDEDGTLREAAGEATALLKEIEGAFFDLRHTGTGQDGLRWRRLLYARLGALARSIQSSDAAPTDQHLAVFERLREEWNDVRSRFESEALGAIEDLNARLRAEGVPHVIVRERAEAVPDSASAPPGRDLLAAWTLVPYRPGSRSGASTATTRPRRIRSSAIG